MTADEFRAARVEIGYSQIALASEWSMGKNGGRSVRRWEAGERPVSPTAAYALALMLTNERGMRRLVKVVDDSMERT